MWARAAWAPPVAILVMTSEEDTLNTVTRTKGEPLALVAVSGHLDRAEVRKRPRSMSMAQIDEALQDYVACQSLEKIGKRLGFDSTTVLKELRLRGVQTRDTHGRERR